MSHQRQSFSVHIDGGSDVVDVVGGIHFHLEADSLQTYFGVGLTPRMYDLLRIASTVYVADRVTRRVRNRSTGWSRTFRISLDVYEPEHWSRPATLARLIELLDFLTGDNWTFTFQSDPGLPPGLQEPTLPFEPASVNISLYSGGLDSAAGLAAVLSDTQQAQIVPVLVRHQSGQRFLATKQLVRLERHFHVPLRPLVVRFASVRPATLGQEENTQRSRSFMFCAVGGVAAWLAGSGVVDMHESGVGAVNLPLMAGMVGAKATRSSHPYFLRQMSSLLSDAAGRQIEFRLPHVDRTKAEVVSHLVRLGLVDVAVATASCVHYPLREERSKQCGVCPACIFRRHAMMIAGISEPNGIYKYDLFGPALSANSIPPDKLRYLRAFLMQVEKLSPLKKGSAIPQFLRRHLVGTHVITSESDLAFWCGVYRRYLDEWLRLVNQAHGRDWASLLRGSAAA